MRKSFTYRVLGSNGRLGNQLWQIAWQIGSAGDHHQVCIKPDWEYRQYFSIDDACYGRPTGKVVDGGTLYYQELHHWEAVADRIHASFQPSQLSLDYLKANYPDWFFDPTVHKTAIHVRAGDYLTYPTRFPVPTDRYYLGAAEQVPADTRFVVFSDDIEFAREKLKRLAGDVVFIEGTGRSADPTRRRGEPQDQWDLFLQAKCTAHIIANSTFSWWGAYLADSETVLYPSVWWGRDIDARDSRGIDIRKSWVDAIPEDWVQVAC